MEANKENLTKMLRGIGWDVVGRELNTYIANKEGKKTDWRVCEDRIEFDTYKDHGTCCFYYKDCFLEMLEKTTVSLTAKSPENSVFVFFANYDIK